MTHLFWGTASTPPRLFGPQCIYFWKLAVPPTIWTPIYSDPKSITLVYMIFLLHLDELLTLTNHSGIQKVHSISSLSIPGPAGLQMIVRLVAAVVDSAGVGSDEGPGCCAVAVSYLMLVAGSKKR